MIIGIFCFPQETEKRSTMKNICSLCHIEQDFHLDCIRDAKKDKGYIICTECYGFMQVNFNSQTSLFEIVCLF